MRMGADHDLRSIPHVETKDLFFRRTFPMEIHKVETIGICLINLIEDVERILHFIATEALPK